MCDCLAVLSRIIIGTLSLIFSILGFGLLVIGIIIKVNIDTLKQAYDPLVQVAKSQAESAVGNNIALPTDNFGTVIQDLVGGLGTAFIVLGAVMLVIGVFGVAGSCCMVKWMIICYMIVLALMTAGSLIIVIILAVNSSIITEPPKAGLTKTLQDEYRGLNGSDVTSLLWNTIMSWQQCCGVNNYKDFEQAAGWLALYGPNGTVFQFEMPAACCKAGQFSPPSVSCTMVTSPDNNKAVGCYDKLLKLVLDTYFVPVGAGTVSFLALLTFFAAVILYKALKKNKVAP